MVMMIINNGLIFIIKVYFFCLKELKYVFFYKKLKCIIFFLELIMIVIKERIKDLIYIYERIEIYGSYFIKF